MEVVVVVVVVEVVGSCAGECAVEWGVVGEGSFTASLTLMVVGWMLRSRFSRSLRSSAWSISYPCPCNYIKKTD